MTNTEWTIISAVSGHALLIGTFLARLHSAVTGLRHDINGHTKNRDIHVSLAKLREIFCSHTICKERMERCIKDLKGERK